MAERDTSKSIGRTYGRLKVVKIIGRNESNKLIVSCICSCGNKINKVLEYIQWGDTQSCGCLRKEKANTLRHGMAKTRFYRIYYAINKRTRNDKSINWKWYGGKGIKCLWKSFEEFHKDMYQSYKRHVELHGEHQTTIDRIDSMKHYCRKNCRWATRIQQARNKIITDRNHNNLLPQQ